MLDVLFAFLLQTTPPPLVRIQTPPPKIYTTPVIQPAPTPTWRFGRWIARDVGSFTVASTTNDSQSAYGVMCGQECVWFVNMQTDCTQSHKYPAMINSPSGSLPITLTCYHLGDLRVLTYAFDEDSLGVLEKEGEVGFAIPLESGRFGVSRFSLGGSVAAISKAVDVAIEKRKVNQEGLRDFTI